MSLVRTAIIAAAVVAVLPSDRAQQERLQQSFADAAHWTVTFCDRQPQTCSTAATGWDAFKAKAEFAFVMLYDVAVQQAFGDGPGPVVHSGMGATGSTRAPVSDAESGSARARSGTLTTSDLEPQWRGVMRAPRS